jgi:hypothetical protein
LPKCEGLAKKEVLLRGKGLAMKEKKFVMMQRFNKKIVKNLCQRIEI